MEREAFRDWLALALWENLGPGGLSKIRQSLPEPWRVLNEPGLLDVIFTGKKHPGSPPAIPLKKQADDLIDLSEKGRFGILSILDPEYPVMLANTHSPPAVLFYRGDRSLLKRHSLAVVGTRRPSRYGKDVTVLFAGTLAEKGFVIVSGMAVGIDAVAHSAAIGSNGKTVAVLGCGLDIDYPKSNRELRAHIERSGCVISEFPWGTPPNPGQFPRRNRIISGLSRGVLVMESTERSGALITVKHALDQDRDVFAVPGSVFSPGSRGPVRVLQNGGYPVLHPAEIVEHYSMQTNIPFPQAVVSGTELDIDPELRPIWDLLDATPVSGDELVGALRWNAADIQAALLKMELLGLVRQLPGQRFVRAVTTEKPGE
jgi:DNA processing protein